MTAINRHWHFTYTLLQKIADSPGEQNYIMNLSDTEVEQFISYAHIVSFVFYNLYFTM
jgi:hypothetical protein